MKEIKFRAWDKAFDKMINFDDTLAKEWILGLTLWGDVIGCDLKALEPKSSHETYIITYPERFELMQYTGLKDKNGQEIYEGDILRWKCSKSGSKAMKNYIVTIQWESHHYNLIIYDNGEKWRTYRSDWNEENREIIGNRWDNTELLEVRP